MAVGFTINHISAVFIPIMGGLIWIADYQVVFVGDGGPGSDFTAPVAIDSRPNTQDEISRLTWSYKMVASNYNTRLDLLNSPAGIRMKENELPKVFLQTGDCFIGVQPTLVNTVLGSCLAVTMHAPKMGIGTICHAFLPDSSDASTGTAESRKYAGMWIQLCKICWKQWTRSGSPDANWSSRCSAAGPAWP